MALYNVQQLRFLVRGGAMAALKLATGVLLRPFARELTIATDTKSMRVGDGTNEYVDLPILNPLSPCFQYKTETGSTADSDPGAGLFKWNHATQANATFLYFDDATADTATDLSTLFSSLSGAPTGFVHIVLEEDRTKWQVWKWTAITDATGYWKFAVTLQASTASLSDNLPVRVSFTPLSSTAYTDENVRDVMGVALVAGTNMAITVDDGANTITLDASGGGGSGGISFVGSYTVTGSAAQVMSVTGLDLGADTEYRIQVVGHNDNVATCNYSLYVSGDTAAANYERQAMNANGGSLTSARANDAIFTSAIASETLTGWIEMMSDFDGRARAICRFNRDSAALLRLDFTAWTKLAAGNVTSITLSGSVTSCFAVGSTMRVYKVTP